MYKKTNKKPKPKHQKTAFFPFVLEVVTDLVKMSFIAKENTVFVHTSTGVKITALRKHKAGSSLLRKQHLITVQNNTFLHLTDLVCQCMLQTQKSIPLLAFLTTVEKGQQKNSHGRFACGMTTRAMSTALATEKE